LHTRNPLDGAAGDAFTANLRRQVREAYGVHIGRDQAEHILFDPVSKISAFNERSGRVEELPLTTEVVNAAMRDPLDRLARLLMTTLEEARAALGEQARAEISRRGVLLTGGGTRLPGLEDALRERTAEGFVRPEKPDETAIQGLLKMEAWA
jgi:actin-like ATPase involved in cell morphogenesis